METLQSSHQGNESEDVMGLDVIQNIRNTREAGTRGEDWEEVSFTCVYLCSYLNVCRVLREKSRLSGCMSSPCLRWAARLPLSPLAMITSSCFQTASTPAGLWTSHHTTLPRRSRMMMLHPLPIQTSCLRARKSQPQRRAGWRPNEGGRRGQRTHGLKLSLLPAAAWTRCCAPPRPWTLWRSALK